MFKLISALVFTSFFLIIYGNEPVSLYENVVNSKENAEYYLAEIRIEEALPIILFEKPPVDGNPFDFPETIDKVVILNDPEQVDGIDVEGKKMLSGTSFSTAYSNKPMFLCRKQNSPEICLVPQDFAPKHRLVCPVQPTPSVRVHSEVPCGHHQNTRNYSMGYEICEQPDRYKEGLVAVYLVCYDQVNRKGLYTSHYILSPKLLRSYLLFRERQLKYAPMVQYFLPTLNQAEIQNNSLTWMALETRPSASKPVYRVQMLAPSQDFALGSWIRTTYQYVNMEFQHDSLYTVWNNMVYLVGQQAIEADKEDIVFYIRTGVFNLELDALPNDGQKYNIWVKVVTSMRKDTEDTLQGVAFMANNFITENSQIHEKILHYCKHSLCARHYRERTHNKVLCCMITVAIAQLFGPGVVRPHMEMLEINGINETRRK